MLCWLEVTVMSTGTSKLSPLGETEKNTLPTTVPTGSPVGSTVTSTDEVAKASRDPLPGDTDNLALEFALAVAEKVFAWPPRLVRVIVFDAGLVEPWLNANVSPPGSTVVGALVPPTVRCSCIGTVS